VTFTKDELLAALPEVAYYLDTPATWTAVCQWFLNKRIAEDGGVVVLSGEGADELFGGYARYRVLHWLDTMIADPHLAGYGPLIQHAFGEVQPVSVPAHMLNRGGVGTLNHAITVVWQYGRGRTLVDTMSRVDFYTTMQALVRMADRMAACFGMENRSPFFDYRLMELSALIPSKTKITEHESKTILRQVARGLGVSWQITGERTKRGLTVPASWGDGKWSRGWFAKEMQIAWRARCLRPALCSNCESCGEPNDSR
jgi:asparagine synthase (glutamine-hydrolysing)